MATSEISKLPAIHRRDSNEIEERMLTRVGNREETRSRKVKRVKRKMGWKRELRKITNLCIIDVSEEK